MQSRSIRDSDIRERDTFPILSVCSAYVCSTHEWENTTVTPLGGAAIVKISLKNKIFAFPFFPFSRYQSHLIFLAVRNHFFNGTCNFALLRWNKLYQYWSPEEEASSPIVRKTLVPSRIQCMAIIRPSPPISSSSRYLPCLWSCIYCKASHRGLGPSCSR